MRFPDIFSLSFYHLSFYHFIVLRYIKIILKLRQTFVSANQPKAIFNASPNYHDLGRLPSLERYKIIRIDVYRQN